MKKMFTILAVSLLLTFALGSFALAEVKDEVPQWYQDMISWKKAQVKQSVQDGYLTEEQAKIYNAQLDASQDLNTPNGYGWGYGGCHSYGNTTNYRGGFGPGMMRGWGW
ncbi:hypothetical protein [Anaerosolibacter sp.]|uniref:hypothetical protein n=1 Tax=Anaerosolibacter sp. TaxID=1872527 RepID=UPI0039F04679